jgi:hypothetical protein
MKFKDGKNREWDLMITLATVKTVNEKLGINIVSPGTIVSIYEDSVFLAKVLWAMCSNQAATMIPRVKEDDFLESISGDIVDNAMEGLCDAFVNFFPLSQRIAYRDLVGEITIAKIKSIGMMLNAIKDPAILQRKSSDDATNSPDIAE